MSIRSSLFPPDFIAYDAVTGEFTKGVTFDKRRGKWAAEIRVNNRKIFLGRFDTIDEAAEKRKRAESEMFGEYSYERSRG